MDLICSNSLQSTRRENSSVAWVLAAGVPRLDLQPRLTAMAESDLSALLVAISQISLDPSSDDVRHIRGAPSVRFSTAIGYSLAFSHLPDDAFATLIWHNLAPSRCRSFLWLVVHQDKLNTF